MSEDTSIRGDNCSKFAVCEAKEFEKAIDCGCFTRIITPEPEEDQ